MSAPTTQLTNDERTRIQTQSTVFYHEIAQDPMTQKLLLCLLETVQGLSEEVKSLRKTNEEMRQTLSSIVSSKIYNGHTMNTVNISNTSG
jgi:hypothetical protein